MYDNDIRPSRKEPKKTMPLGEDVNGNARNREHRPHRPSRERLFISPSPSSDDDRGSGNPGNTTNVEVRDSHWEGFDGPMEEVRGTLYNSEASNMPQMNEGQGYGVATPSNSAQGIRAILEEDEDDPQSHAAMSKRAEQILANAKKRLLVSGQVLS